MKIPKINQKEDAFVFLDLMTKKYHSDLGR
jgi:hypothetical protein